MAFSVKRLFARLLKAAVVSFILYLVAINAFLNSGWILSKINKRPERLRMEYEWALSVWPTELYVWKWRLRGKTDRMRYDLSLDRARATVRVEDLLEKTFHASELEGTGFVAAFEFPETIGDPNAPQPLDANQPAPDATPRKPGWTVQLDAIRFERFRELRMGPYRLVGQARIHGGFLLRTRRLLRVPPTTIDVLSVEMYRSEDKIAHELRGRVIASIDEVDPRKLQDMELARSIRATATVDAKVDGVGFVQYYLARSPVVLEGGAGSLHAELKVDRGRFLPGSNMEIHTPQIQLGIPGYVMRGKGHVYWDVRNAGRKPDLGTEASLGIDLDDFSMQAVEFSKPHVQGSGLKLRASGQNMTVFEPIQSPVLQLNLPEAQIPDATVYDGYMPAGSGLHLRSGHGSIQLGLRASGVTNLASGDITVKAEKVRAHWNELRLAGNWKLTTRLVRAELQNDVYDLSGSVFTLRDAGLVDTTDTEKQHKKQDITGWWANITLLDARYTPKQRVTLTARLKIAMRDARPVIKIFSMKKELPGFVKKIFVSNDLEATGKLTLGKDLIEVKDFVLNADKIEVFARIRLRGSELRGLLYARYGVFSVGVDLRDGDTDLKITRPKKWYLEYPPF